MNREQTIDRILVHKVIAIVRMSESSWLLPAIEALIGGGICVLEITSNTPDYLKAISSTRQRYPDTLVGAGTITNKVDALAAATAGAQFLVSPNTTKDIVDVACQFDIPVVMGALTPSEIAAAIEYKADFVKLFPAGILGVEYLRSLRGPYRDIRFIPVGGIDQKNILEWLKCGVAGVGIGSSLVPDTITSQRGIDEIRLRSKQLIEQLSAHE